MPRRIAMNALNASTIDILNTIRQNADAEYQSLVPVVESTTDIPKVGEIIYGYPSIANKFISTLVNRIALVRAKSMTFNNPYAPLKKGYLEFGETVEEAYVNITKARTFDVEKAGAREFKRSLPDVRTAFHLINWRVQYPITIQDEDLRMAFLSANGVQDLIAKIVDAVYTGAEYDEYLLFKYLMIKAITKGQMYPVAFSTADLKNGAKAFRGISNLITFPKTEYNASHVLTVTPKANQYIFLDAMFDAEFDVDVLSSAFNMEKAEYMGKRYLIDDWTTFDMDRFSEIMAQSDGLEEVTSAELALMADVKAVLIDDEWFQIYDNLAKMTEKYVASGLYWNYFYNVWKTVSSSPFANAIVFVTTSATITAPATLTGKVATRIDSDDATILTIELTESGVTNQTAQFVQTEDLTELGVAVHPYGAYIIPDDALTDMTPDATEAVPNPTPELTITAALGSDTYSLTDQLADLVAGASITLTKDV